MSLLTQSHQVIFGRPLCLIPSTSHVIQRLTQSLSSFRSTYPNHLNLLFLIIKLTGSNPKSSPSSSLFFLSFSLIPHIHLIILISMWFSFSSCSRADRQTNKILCLYQTVPRRSPSTFPGAFYLTSEAHLVITVYWQVGRTACVIVTEACCMSCTLLNEGSHVYKVEHFCSMEAVTQRTWHQFNGHFPGKPR